MMSDDATTEGDAPQGTNAADTAVDLDLELAEEFATLADSFDAESEGIDVTPQEETPAAPQEGDPPAETPAEATPESTPEAPETPGDETEPSPKPSEETPADTETPPAEPTPPTETSEPTEPTPEELATQREQYRLKVEEHFAIPEQLVEELEENPAKVLPKLMAKVYMDMVGQAQRLIADERSNLSQHIKVVTQREQQVQQNNERFFARWPQLNKPEYSETIGKIGGLWRQLNPKGTAEDFLEEVGAQAAMRLKLPLQSEQGTPQPTPFAPAAPTSMNTGGSVPAAAATPSAPAPTNSFDILAQEIEAEMA